MNFPENLSTTLIQKKKATAYVKKINAILHPDFIEQPVISHGSFEKSLPPDDPKILVRSLFFLQEQEITQQDLELELKTTIKKNWNRDVS